MVKKESKEAREKQLRRMAERAGLIARKDRRSGSWMLVDVEGGTVVAANQPLQWAEKYLADALRRGER